MAKYRALTGSAVKGLKRTRWTDDEWVLQGGWREFLIDIIYCSFLDNVFRVVSRDVFFNVCCWVFFHSNESSLLAVRLNITACHDARLFRPPFTIRDFPILYFQRPLHLCPRVMLTTVNLSSSNAETSFLLHFVWSLLFPYVDRYAGDISFAVYFSVFCLSTKFCSGYLRRGLRQGDEIWQDGRPWWVAVISYFGKLSPRG